MNLLKIAAKHRDRIKHTTKVLAELDKACEKIKKLESEKATLIDAVKDWHRIHSKNVNPNSYICSVCYKLCSEPYICLTGNHVGHKGCIKREGLNHE